MININKNYYFTTLVFLVSIILLRIIPHPANAVPIFALLYIWNNTGKLGKGTAIVATLIAILGSDIILTSIYQYPIFVKNNLFTYSGFICTMLLYSNKITMRLNMAINVLAATVIYWLWTNFGVWLMDAMYPLTFSGLIKCYVLALPFLQYSMVANLIGIVLYSYLGMSFVKVLTAK